MSWLPLGFSLYEPEPAPIPPVTLHSQEENEAWSSRLHLLSNRSQVIIDAAAVPYDGYDGHSRRRHEDLHSILVHAKSILESCWSLQTLSIEPSWVDFTRRRHFEPLQAHRELVVAAANTYSTVFRRGRTNCVTVQGSDWPIITQIYSYPDPEAFNESIHCLHMRHTVNVGKILSDDAVYHDRSDLSEPYAANSLAYWIGEVFGNKTISNVVRHPFPTIVTDFALQGETPEYLWNIQNGIQRRFEARGLSLGPFLA